MSATRNVGPSQKESENILSQYQKLRRGGLDLLRALLMLIEALGTPTAVAVKVMFEDGLVARRMATAWPS
jgi:hypothetical protein